MDAPGDERGGPQARVQSQLSVGDSWFWVADESPAHANFSPPSLGGGTVRMAAAEIPLEKGANDAS